MLWCRVLISHSNLNRFPAQSEITKALSSYFREFILQLFPPHDNELVQTIQEEEAINGRQEITGAIATDERISHHMV